MAVSLAGWADDVCPDSACSASSSPAGWADDVFPDKGLGSATPSPGGVADGVCPSGSSEGGEESQADMWGVTKGVTGHCTGRLVNDLWEAKESVTCGRQYPETADN